MAAGDGVVNVLGFGKIEELAELPNFLVDSHFLQERINAPANRGLIGSGASRSLRNGEGNQCERKDKHKTSP